MLPPASALPVQKNEAAIKIVALLEIKKNRLAHVEGRKEGRAACRFWCIDVITQRTKRQQP